MPRGKSSKRANLAPATPAELGEDEVTTATAADVAEAVAEADEDAGLDFEIVSAPAPEDFQPNRKTPGRTRRPSYFDDVLKREDVFGKGWQMVQVTSDEHKAYVLRELNRAKLHLGVGLELDTDQDDAVYYKSRELQKRERKNKDENGSEAEAEGTENEEVTETDEVDE